MRRLALVLALVFGAVSLAGCGLSWNDPFHPHTHKR